jgi:predicted NAD/FAD-binding protein
MRKRIAIIGSGISGLSAAYFLRNNFDITLFEKNAYFGGHANSVNVKLKNQKNTDEVFPVDTGFLVFNERTYPGLIDLFKSLDVRTSDSDMSFSVQADVSWLKNTLEWSGSDLNTVFAQRSNIFRLNFWLLLKEIIRFNRITTSYIKESLAGKTHENDALSLHAYLEKYKFGEVFQQGYLLPMLGCIWSCELETMLNYPIKSLASFCHNHGLLQVINRPQWFTVTGGSVNYVKKITDAIEDKRLNTPIVKIHRQEIDNELKVQVYTELGSEVFDGVLLACHAPEALQILYHPSEIEKNSLGAITTQQNTAVLHTDETVMPQRKSAWAAWNFENIKENTLYDNKGICLHYWINKLQPLPFTTNVFVTLNEKRKIDENKVIKRIQYAHPVLDEQAVKAQEIVKTISGISHTWYAGAWMGSGFHEDGFQAGKIAADSILKEFGFGVRD